MRNQLAIIVLACFCAAPALAGEGGSPGYFTVRKGGIEVIALLDSYGKGKPELLVGAGEADLERAREPGALDTSINAFVVKMNGKTYLFDAGLPNGGLAESLAEAGLKPLDIDAVFITHFHFDHVGGLLKDGKAVYSRADLHVPKVEVDKWNDRGTEFLSVYAARSNAFDWGKEVVPGVTAQSAAGHTPGHTVFRLEADGGKLLIIGDLIHLPGIQLQNPDVAVSYDTDPVAAVAARKRIFAEAASEGITVASMHIPFPGLGVLEAEGEGYEFVKEK